MFLDIHGSIPTEKQNTESDKLRDSIMRGLKDQDCKVTMEQNGSIKWQAPWITRFFQIRRLWGMRGEVRFTGNYQNKIIINYYINTHIRSIMDFGLSAAIIILVYSKEEMPLEIMVALILFLLLSSYVNDILFTKWWFKRFLKKLSK